MKLEDVRQHYRDRTKTPARAGRGESRGPAGHAGLAAALDAELVVIAGSSFYVETVLQDPSHHGRHRLQDLTLLPKEPLAMAAHDESLLRLDMTRTVFLDTETTGLGIGTGTYAFLVGVGHVRGGAFAVRRYFLGSPSEEVAFLDELGAFLGQFDTLVTFNGKAFDLPILENRYTLHRRSLPMEGPRHVDLLHPARRLWKRRLTSCALSHLETQVLGLAPRIGDVAGADIPAMYFAYQRSRDIRPLEAVFRHNLLDVLSLAALMVHVGQVLAHPRAEQVAHALDLLSIAAIYERAGRSEHACACLEEALQAKLPAEARQDCLGRLAVLHRRRRDWSGASDVWRRMLDEGGAAALFALVERAKYREHVERDTLRAIEDVQRALLLAGLNNENATSAETEVWHLERRLARLVGRAIRERSRMSAASGVRSVRGERRVEGGYVR